MSSFDTLENTLAARCPFCRREIWQHEERVTVVDKGRRIHLVHTACAVEHQPRGEEDGA